MTRGATVVVAAGHGCLRPDKPKLVEHVDGMTQMSMIGQVLRTAMAVGDPIVVVLNDRFAEQVLDAMRRDCPALCSGEMRHLLHICYQAERRGAADAVRRAVTEVVVPLGVPSFLVMYGDMPLWRPDTMRRLWSVHREQGAALSMVSVDIGRGSTPQTLERYGRVLKDAAGRIVNVIEPGETMDADVLMTTTVNPSLYVFDTAWFSGMVSRIPPHPRPDGYGDELHLPPLTRIAAEHGVAIAELPLDDPEEALGVNTPEEMEEIRQIVRRRLSQPTQACAAC